MLAQARRCAAELDAIAARDGAAIARLMESLVMAGVAISYAGCSRPASGCEHHMAHYNEVTALREGRGHMPHGADVAYGTAVSCALRRSLAGAPDISGEVRAILLEAPDEAEILSYLGRLGYDMREYFDYYGAENIRGAIVYSKDLKKDRYSLFSFLHELGRLESFADDYINAIHK